MTLNRTALAVTIGLLLAVAPAANAATTSAYDSGGKIVTLTNDGDGETFDVTLTSGSPATYKVTATNATIPVPTPAGSNCTSSDAGKTLNCTTTDVNRIDIDGGAGNDRFTVSGSDNYYYTPPGLGLAGEGGNDTFTAGPGSALHMDTISGGPGDDTFNGSNAYVETFFPEEGNDTYNAGTAPVPPGFDPVSYQVVNRRDTYNASPLMWIRMRRLDVTPVTISLDGQPNDTDGMGGIDNLIGFERVEGTEAGDTLTAGADPAVLSGGDGDDTITGGPDRDVLNGGSGNDTMRGGAGADELYDGDYDLTYRLASNPALTPGNDTLDGGDGDDVLVFGAGKDDVVGGAGVDTAFYSRVATQVFDSLPSDDVAIQWAATSVSLDDQANDGITGSGEGDNVHSDVEDVDTTGTSFGTLDRSARLRGTRIQSSEQYAAKGADTIVGSDGPNEIRTGFGNDSVDGKGGADVVDLGAGDDQANAIDMVTDVIRCGIDTDNVGADLAGTNAPRADVLSDCENVSGTPLGLEGGVLPTLPVIPTLALDGKATVKVKSFLKKYTVGVGVTSDQATTATGELTTTQATITKVGALSVGSGKLASGTGKRTLKLKVAKKFRKKLKRKLHTKKQRRKGIKLTAVITVKNASGQDSTARRTIKIKG